jgi:cell wall-associated NlpC family hydrolase
MNNIKLITKDQKFAFCMVSVAPIRLDKADQSEIVSQLLFGEPIEVILFGEPWVKIRTIHDGYEGFVDFKHLLPLTEKELKKWLNEFSYQSALILVLETPWGNQLTSKGSFVSQDSVFQIGNFRFSWTASTAFQKTISDHAKELINVPYLWGGKSVFGIDCSGFVQLIFRLNGINLPRDAYQQAELGELIVFEESCSGDLAFFENSSGKIIHVGIILENNKIIHASGRVRVDSITKSGILNLDYGLETHRLVFIKRMI